MLYRFIAFIIFSMLQIIFAVDEGATLTTEILNNTLNEEEGEKLAPKRKRFRPPGAQTYQKLHDKKFLEILQKNKGENETVKFARAKESADEYVKKMKEDAKRRHDRKKANDRDHGILPQKRPKGYDKVENRINRRARSMMKVDDTLAKDEARKMAEMEHEIFKIKRNTAQKLHRERQRELEFEKAKGSTAALNNGKKIARDA